VTIMDVDTEEEKIYSIVGADEADVKEGKISVISPVARSLINKEIGDIVTVKTPVKTLEYEILDISYS
jgi:transcription elongation factor GreA